MAACYLDSLTNTMTEASSQEPGTDEEIIEFVKKYGVTFDMFHKINVNGANAIPLYKV